MKKSGLEPFIAKLEEESRPAKLEWKQSGEGCIVSTDGRFRIIAVRGWSTNKQAVSFVLEDAQFSNGCENGRSLNPRQRANESLQRLAKVEAQKIVNREAKANS